jgi:hypothetical protein
MTLAGFRSLLYLIARLIGDLSSVRRGTIGKRIARRAAGRVLGRGMGRIFR